MSGGTGGGFAGKHAVVTGAASGIGRAIALELSAAGATVVAADRNLDGARETASMGDRISAVHLDLAQFDSIDGFAAEVAESLGRVDVLVNAAGWDRIEPFMNNSDEFIRDIVAINYLGPVRLSKALLPPMIEGGEGATIVNVASDAGRVGSTGETVYAGAKGGIIAFTKSLAREMARHKITVNCVCPGPTDTPLFNNQPDGMKAALIKAIPLRRLATPEEISGAVTFFASDRARFITGQVLSVSGGLTMSD
ncbi:MAG TPA: SDR family oxidoreductase [Pseudonocardia sp.]|jgi:NAD(P)-dependent dehydrogenase (short-subunit alcohol dehydrogenase family)|nr:SDR family oxidoreductase [Pseudonocardia sp.]